MMRCLNVGCEGEYEHRHILHILEGHGEGHGEPMAVAQVPAKVCWFCGDTLFDDATLRRLEAIRRTPPAAVGTIPLYPFDGADEQASTLVTSGAAQSDE